MLNKIKFIVYLLSILLFINPTRINAQATGTGEIRGKIMDIETKSPLVGANIVVSGTKLGAAADENGSFCIKNVPVGSRTIKATYLSYNDQTLTDIIVRVNRQTEVVFELKPATYQTGEVVVNTGYFNQTPGSAVTAQAFSYEEVRRAPGSAGDISRILFSLPSLGKVDDQKNSLIVRGGNPMENGFFIDDIEVPNINHFPSQGSTGGALGNINVDLLRDVSFAPGGLNASYGDWLSSVIDMSFREGNRAKTQVQLDFSLMGIGGVAEGPIAEKGSWVLSVRRSYLDMLVKWINVGSTVAPNYADYQFKGVYDISPKNTLEILSTGGYDNYSTDNKVAEENDMTAFAHQDIYEQTTGIALKTLWNEKAYSRNSVSLTTDYFTEDYFETTTQRLLFKNRSKERTLKFRNSNHLKLHDRHSLEFGLEAKYYFHDYDNYYGSRQLTNGAVEPSIQFNKRMQEYKAGAFLQYFLTPISGVTLTTGCRADYFSFTERLSITPKASIQLLLSPVSEITAYAGMYSQTLPMVMHAQNPKNKELSDLKAEQFGIGYGYLLNVDTKLTIEGYLKKYKNFPMNPLSPSAFMLDEMQAGENFMGSYPNLVSEGKAQTYGVEVMVQKKLAHDFYGVVSGTWFRSKYTGLDGVERNRLYDNQYIFNLSGGYKPDENWEFSARWVIAGGIPYTPFDAAASAIAGTGVTDDAKTNAERMPAYHSLNLRVDRRFFFEKSNLVVYISVWNAYNNQNVAQYYWNLKDNKQKTVYQWGALPILGMEYEF
ncbi:MAG: TonB-dependent receptor [Ignavibacteria bacterium]|nr:TonB-dependent receptor [Ignavibacteria bacterium]